MKRFSNLPNISNVGSVETHPKVTPIDDDDQVMISHKDTTVHS
jgi:hypothetical protein